MTKVRQLGSCAEALWTTVAAIGRARLGNDASEGATRAEGIAELAALFGVAEGVVRNMLDPDQPEQLSLDRAGLIGAKLEVDTLARWLAAESGGVFVPLPAEDGNIEKLTAAGVRAVGETAAQVIEAMTASSDAGADLSEAEAIRLGNATRQIIETFSEIAAIVDAARRKAKKAKPSSRPGRAR